MEVRPNLFQKAAFLYDYDDRDIVKDDIPFYLEYAAKYPGTILELACGTGRVALVLAQNGYQVYSGFKIKEEFGYYDKSSIENGKELIFVCSK